MTPARAPQYNIHRAPKYNILEHQNTTFIHTYHFQLQHLFHPSCESTKIQHSRAPKYNIHAHIPGSLEDILAHSRQRFTLQPPRESHKPQYGTQNIKRAPHATGPHHSILPILAPPPPHHRSTHRLLLLHCRCCARTAQPARTLCLCLCLCARACVRVAVSLSRARVPSTSMTQQHTTYTAEAYSILQQYTQCLEADVAVGSVLQQRTRHALQVCCSWRCLV